MLHTETAGAACLPADEVATRRTRLQALDLRPFDAWSISTKRLISAKWQSIVTESDGY